MENPEELEKIYSVFLQSQTKNSLQENDGNDLQTKEKNDSFDSSDEDKSDGENETEINNDNDDIKNIENSSNPNKEDNKNVQDIGQNTSSKEGIKASNENSENHENIFEKPVQITEQSQKEQDMEINKINKSNQDNNSKNKGKIFNPDDYVILMTIGTGNFSEIFLVENIHTKVLYAMKQFLRRRVEQIKKQEEVLMEKHVVNKLTPHRNLISCGGSFRDSVNKIFLKMKIFFNYSKNIKIN